MIDVIHALFLQFYTHHFQITTQRIYYHMDIDGFIYGILLLYLANMADYYLTGL